MKKIVFLSLVLLVLVIPHIVSADTLIVFTSGNEDGQMSAMLQTSLFPTIRVADGTIVALTSTAPYCPGYRTRTTTNYFRENYRCGFEFNTSVIPDDATITSAKLSLFITTVATSLGNPDFGVTGFIPNISGTMEMGDLNAFSDTRLASDLLWADYVSGLYNEWTFNDDGKNYISKTSYTNLMPRFKWDIDNDTTGLTWSSDAYTRFTIAMSETTGNTSDPKLTITYTAGGVSAPVASFTASKNFIRIPNLVSVTDTSTNTPTSWEWSWGDGTANSTTQNPSHQYLKRGKFSIVLTATNAGGSGSTSAYNVRVAGYENG